MQSSESLCGSYPRINNLMQQTFARQFEQEQQRPQEPEQHIIQVSRFNHTAYFTINSYFRDLIDS